jgi:hypothetical protein
MFLLIKKKKKDLLLVVVLFAFLPRGIKQTKKLGLDFLKFWIKAQIKSSGWDAKEPISGFGLDWHEI